MRSGRLTKEQLARRPVVTIVGPTAVGKSEIAIRVAKALGTEILTADSRQVYRGMDIGTDKPSLPERQGVPHRLIDLINPDQPFNAGRFREAALGEIHRLHREGTIPLVVGGTGLYVRVLLRGLWAGPSADWHVRAELEQDAQQHGPGHLHHRLAVVDPNLAARLHPHDHVKIIRALEVYRLSGRPLSEAHDRHRFASSELQPLVIGLIRQREVLYARIEDRVETQLRKGLLEETRDLLARGYHRDLGSMKGLGYRQIGGYVVGEYGYDEAVRRLKRDTRRFAKRQLTWFRREPDVRWLSIDESEGIDATTGRVLIEIERFLSEVGTGEGTMRTCQPVGL
jgi:tRNA dimethylallyltransferase